MHLISLRIVLALAMIVPAAAQSPLEVGHRSVAWPNTTGVGSPLLDSVVYYPSPVAGEDVPIAASTANPQGWPVVVFLHGYGLLGSDYSDLTTKWVRAGFVVVLSETSQWDYFGQAADGRALHSAVIAADIETGGPFEGALDAHRMAIVGHSMGAANVGNVLVNNPGYRCGLAFAPVAPLGTDLTLVTVPFGILAGAGDSVTPWSWHALPYYLSLTSHGSFKFLHVLGDDCDHMNFVGLETTEPHLFDTTAITSIGFLQHCLDVQPNGLESVFGPDALADLYLDHAVREVVVPQVWVASTLQIGTRTRVSMVVEGGPAVLLAAAALSPAIPTPFGDLLLDPASLFVASIGQADAFDRADMVVDVPADPMLVGLPIALQALGNGLGDIVLLGSATLTSLQQ
jgi:predicted esterase